MTGTECFRAALNILSETPDSGVYYEQFALGALNQLLANSLREMNAERASDGKDVLLVPPHDLRPERFSGKAHRMAHTGAV